jgi:hypothetical protein
VLSNQSVRKRRNAKGIGFFARICFNHNRVNIAKLTIGNVSILPGGYLRREDGMKLWGCCLLLVVTGLTCGIALAQLSVPPPPQSRIPALISIPVPYDPSEIVTSGAQLVQGAEERATTLQLLQAAHRLSNVRLRPYDLKTSFRSYGTLPSDGRWSLEDISPGAGIYRWTAEGPSYSGIFLTVDKLLSSNVPEGAVPLRLAQVRSAIFGIYFPEIGSYATLRVATGYLNGAELRCVLVARGGFGNNQPSLAPGRSLEESEYCVDPRNGLLALYSPFPGEYIHYDNDSALHFHEITVPDGFTITEGGKAIIEARTESVTDAPPKNSNIFTPAGLNTLAAGTVSEVPSSIRLMQPFPDNGSTDQVGVAVVHGVVTPDGKINEVELLTSTNPALEAAAIERVTNSPMGGYRVNPQPGAARQPREIVFTEEFIPRPPCPPNMRLPSGGVGSNFPCKPAN